MERTPFFLYVLIVLELYELGCFCAVGTLIDFCVSTHSNNSFNRSWNLSLHSCCLLCIILFHFYILKWQIFISLCCWSHIQILGTGRDRPRRRRHALSCQSFYNYYKYIYQTRTYSFSSPFLHTEHLCSLSNAIWFLIILQFDRYYNELLAFKWYSLPINEQKAFVLILNAAKMPKNLRIADLVSLNASTFLTVNYDYYWTDLVHRNRLPIAPGSSPPTMNINAFLFFLPLCRWSIESIRFQCSCVPPHRFQASQCIIIELLN